MSLSICIFLKLNRTKLSLRFYLENTKMFKIFIKVILLSSTIILNAIPADRIERSYDSVISTKSLFENCTNCIDIPCQLPSDPTCNLKSYYTPNSQYVSFQLSIKLLKFSWIGIVLNSAEIPGMVGNITFFCVFNFKSNI